MLLRPSGSNFLSNRKKYSWQVYTDHQTAIQRTWTYNNVIKESVDRADNTNIVDIIIAGDFNFNMALNSDNKITELVNEFHLSQLITESTHFTEHSASTIDLVLVRNTANILQSHVLDPFIPDQVRYHAQSLFT